jgi:dephospho-CoA kinase
MSHSAKIVSAIFYEHALVAILAVSVIHAMKREQSRILVVSAILEISVARVIWRDSLAKIADHEYHRVDIQ